MPIDVGQGGTGTVNTNTTTTTTTTTGGGSGGGGGGSTSSGASSSGSGGYTIRQGDTLWQIAKDLLGDGSRWPEILALNPDAVSRAGDPTTLKIGFSLVLPGEGDETTDEQDDFDAAVIPGGGRLVKVNNPDGSDAAALYYVVYDWNGVEFAYEIGDKARLDELFGGVEFFDEMSTFSQGGFDSQGFVLTGTIDSQLGNDESITSQIEREIRALGMEDLPSWLSESPEALSLIATATAEEWSSGRLWTELSTTQAFDDRFGDIIGVYTQGGIPIGEAVEQIIADETAFRSAVRQFTMGADFDVTNEYIHSVLSQGWTASAAIQVLSAAEVLRNNTDMLDEANAVLDFVGLGSLDEVGLINALQGHGPTEVIEALNTAAAGVALAEAGLDDIDLDLLASVVDTSDRLLTPDSFAQLAQELAFNVARFGPELAQESFGISEDDIVAAMFGRESPSGRTAGETLNLLAKFERNRREGAEGFDASQAFVSDQGRLVVQGLGGL